MAECTHGTAVRGSLAEVVKAAIDGGSAAGKAIIMTSGDVTLAEFQLLDPAMSRSGFTLTLLGGPITATAVANGTAAKGKIVDSDGVTVIAGNAGTVNAVFVIDNVTIVTGQTCRLLSGTYVAAE